MAFATYEMKIVLAEVLSRVTLRAAPGPAVKVVRRGITFAPGGGTPVIVEARADRPDRAASSPGPLQG
jgi:cytochrome P450